MSIARALLCCLRRPSWVFGCCDGETEVGRMIPRCDTAWALDLERLLHHIDHVEMTAPQFRPEAAEAASLIQSRAQSLWKNQTSHPG